MAVLEKEFLVDIVLPGAPPPGFIEALTIAIFSQLFVQFLNVERLLRLGVFVGDVIWIMIFHSSPS